MNERILDDTFIWVSSSDDSCNECKKRNGKIYTSEDLPFYDGMDELPPLHPNCKCTMVSLRDFIEMDDTPVKLSTMEALLYGTEKTGIGILGGIEGLWRVPAALGSAALGLAAEFAGTVVGKDEEWSRPFYNASRDFLDYGKSMSGKWNADVAERYDEENLSKATKIIGEIERIGSEILTGAAVGKLITALTAAENLQIGKAKPPFKSVSVRDELLEDVTNPELKKVIEQLYRQTATVGDGGTAAAIRQEILTGIPVGGKSHLQKGADSIKWLTRLLQEQDFEAKELAIIGWLLDELTKALRGQ